jgi:predicted dehydrogenase
VRKGPRSDRSRDVSVVLDLMIHDIDLALSLTDAEPLAVESEGDEEAIRAEATFGDGFTAIFTAARNAEARERTMRIVYPSGVLEIDFVTRAFSNSTPRRRPARIRWGPAWRASSRRCGDCRRGRW